MSIPDFFIRDEKGYDPYNHTGVQVERELFRRDMGEASKLKDKVLVMDRPNLDLLRKEMLTELAPKPRFMTHGLMGMPVITPQETFFGVDHGWEDSKDS